MVEGEDRYKRLLKDDARLIGGSPQQRAKQRNVEGGAPAECFLQALGRRPPAELDTSTDIDLKQMAVTPHHIPRVVRSLGLSVLSQLFGGLGGFGSGTRQAATLGTAATATVLPGRTSEVRDRCSCLGSWDAILSLGKGLW